MLPVRPLRAALLAFVSALALVEAGAGLIVGQAWRLVNTGEITATERADLNAMLERLRVMEDVVIAGALATTLLWSLVAVYNATFGARGRPPQRHDRRCVVRRRSHPVPRLPGCEHPTTARAVW